MINLIDKVVLFLCCLTIYLLEPSLGMDVVPVLFAVICSCLLSYLSEMLHWLAAVLLYFAAAVFLPGAALFLPLIAYDCLMSKKQWVCLLAAIPLGMTLPAMELSNVIYLLILMALSLLIKFRTKESERLRGEYNQLRDTTREMALRLKQQNADLMARQDDEIKVATLNERNRIAREIHDNVGHQLSRALLQIGALLAVKKSRGDEEEAEPIRELKETLSQAMDSIRSSVHNLYDESVDLEAQFSALAGSFAFCPLDYEYDIRTSPGSRLKYAFIAIAKEGLSNIVKHSNATKVRMLLREHPAFYQLIIADNGEVSDYDADKGIGLKNIAGRVEAFRGHFHISLKNGFELFISIPKEDTNL